ncbi:hypothetical protein [Rheinheimera sp.]|uniref:hypothetical protein n=1 Tax=Rheinheimera sp. TaxID=1869214 RepID=UPI0027373E82|nr:hypothetical protein [Rheinheimera sp.]MDP2716991.1 hypothetical protein [Rheinheimera sp.]
METLQHFLTQLTSTWLQVETSELISFGIFFGAMWLIAMAAEAAIEKVTSGVKSWIQ